MKRLLLKLTSILFIIANVSYSQDPKNDRDFELFEKIDRLITPISKSNNFSGNVLVKSGKSTVVSKSYGYFDRENKVQNTSDTKFLIGSISAMFTSVAIMQLVENQKINLDDKVAKFLTDIPNGEKITIHHLLTERSGLPRVVSNADGSYARLTQTPHTLDQLVEYIGKLEPIAEPGMKYRHSGSSFILLAKIIEMQSGNSYGEYLQSNIFNPLEMTNTGHYGFKVDYQDIPNLANGYEPEGVDGLKIAEKIHWSTKIGHASIYSTVNDLYKFGQAIIHNRLLSVDSWKTITSSYYDTSLGYGISANRRDGRLRYYRSGSTPGFSSYFLVYPEEDLSIIMLSNIKIHIPYFNVPKIAAIVFGEQYEQLNLVNPTAVGYDLAQKLKGVYQFDENFYNPNGTVSISYENDMLLSDGAPLIPAVQEDGKIAKFINRQFWSRLEFVRDSIGNFSKLKFDKFVGVKK
ncbi:serine hydrolase domain-containing protein [Poritiphilus flavus]|uniref:Serine hydrolase n=1 Tax=Poritiphilus flavus TaxID=2697053 RepID=A0A6L9EE38_9FLAO|nr:serine hydrolase domain-containing protein [Poritiphilus flavus]NAS12882.1 serine hydrolase [Poritiphilus flavus]